MCYNYLVIVLKPIGGDSQMIGITSSLALSMAAALTGVTISFYALLPKYDQLWATYPILDSWLLDQHYRAERIRQRALQTGITLVSIGLVGMFLFRH